MHQDNTRPIYRFRDGALDAISRQLNLRSESQLAGVLGITDQQLDKVRHGATVGFPMAARVAKVTGTGDYVGAWVELVTEQPVAA